MCGPDSGWDSIGDFQHGRALSKFFDRLDSTNQLAKTILYNLNPADNELIATMAGNYNDGSSAGKMQFGSAWWFLDQKDGMEKQMNALVQYGPDQPVCRDDHGFKKLSFFPASRIFSPDRLQFIWQ